MLLLLKECELNYLGFGSSPLQKFWIDMGQHPLKYCRRVIIIYQLQVSDDNIINVHFILNRAINDRSEH